MRPGYKQTEVGIIPEDWQQFTLKDACERISVGLATSVTQHYRSSGVPIIRNLNIKDGFFDGRDMLYISEQFAKANASKSAKGLDVLTVHTGANLGDTCVLPEKFHNCQTFTTLITTPRKELLSPQFLCLHMGSTKGKNELARLQTGGGKGNLNTGDLKNYRIEIPPLPEQRAIAEALSDVDALLDGLERLIAKKRDLKKAAMQQLLTGQTRLPGFSGEWDVKPLGDAAEIVMGQSPSSLNYNSKGDGLPLIQGNADIVNRRTISRIFTTQITKRGKAGDILMSVRAPVGEVSRATFDVCLGRGVCAIRFPNDFLYHYLIFLEPNWAKHSKGSTFDSVNSADVNTVEIRVPTDSAEQTAIATILSDMDAEIAALEARRDKTRALKQGMMQELLTGRIRLI